MQKQACIGFCTVVAIIGILYNVVEYRGSAVFAEKSDAASFSSIRTKQESALLDFKSSGCFHSTHFQFTYSSLPTPRVLTVKVTDDSRTSSETLGIVTLTPAQLGRFNNLLNFYRHIKDGGCTTSDTVTFTIFRDGRKVHHETFQDSTCDRETLEDAYVQDLQALGDTRLPTLSLESLVRFSEESRRSGKPVPYRDTPRNSTGAFQKLSYKREQSDSLRHANEMAQNLAGYDKLKKQFNIAEVMLGHINMLPFSLHPTLKAKSPRLVESSWWFDPVVNNRPKYDWNQFLRLHNEVEQVAKKHVWMTAWKNTGTGRYIESQILGMKPDTETDTDEFVTPAWRHAGLRGVPRYELLLRRTDKTWICVYLGKDDPRALVVSADLPRIERRTHPLDSFEISYHPTQEKPEYIIVTPAGKITMNTRLDHETPSWFLKRSKRN